VPLAKLAGLLAKPTSPTEFAPWLADDALRSVLLGHFQRETPHVLRELRDAAAAGDLPRLRNRAHYLKNSADVIGATALQEACRRIVATDEAPAPAMLRQWIADVEAALPGRFFALTDAIPVDQKTAV
jgi:HPt (histidine-containing phosphotransfer) domain-containing protein